MRRWRLHLGTQLPLAGLAQQVNPVVRGWMQYYGAFYRSALDPLLKNATMRIWCVSSAANSSGCGAAGKRWPAGIG